VEELREQLDALLVASGLRAHGGQLNFAPPTGKQVALFRGGSNRTLRRAHGFVESI
jgi:hypothetical protein